MAPERSGKVGPAGEAGLCGGHPFQQMAPRHQQPPQGAQHGIAHQPGFMREERQREEGLEQGKAHIAGQRAQVAAERDAAVARQDGGKDGDEIRHNEGQHHERRPGEGGGPWQGPAKHECGNGKGRRERAPQIVEHLETPHRRNGEGRGSCAPRPGTAPQNPGQELPVAPRPAMPPQGRPRHSGPGIPPLPPHRRRGPHGRTGPRTDRG